MGLMRDLVIIETDIKEFKKLQVNTRFYKDLGVDFVKVSLPSRSDENEIKNILSLNDFYQEHGLKLILSFDIKLLMARLLGENSFEIDFSDPKIRQGLYHFISYLIKHGIKAFDLKGLENLSTGGKDPVKAIRELNKNTFFNKDILSMARLDYDIKTLMALANPSFSCLSLIRPEGEIHDVLSFSNDFGDIRAGLALGFDNFPKLKINFKNYPIYAKRFVFMTLFFLESSIYIEENSLDLEDIRFLRELFSLKKYIDKEASTRKILPKEDSLIAFIRQAYEAKVLFLANKSEKEVLLDIGFQVMDYKGYEFLQGSFGRRKLYRTIVLRPYEAVAFQNCK